MNEIVRKKERGITLIALVITIIVLLILAGISIAMLSGDNGILNRAVQAKEATRGGEAQETVRLAAINDVKKKRVLVNTSSYNAEPQHVTVGKQEVEKQDNKDVDKNQEKEI